METKWLISGPNVALKLRSVGLCKRKLSLSWGSIWLPTSQLGASVGQPPAITYNSILGRVSLINDRAIDV